MKHIVTYSPKRIIGNVNDDTLVDFASIHICMVFCVCSVYGYFIYIYIYIMGLAQLEFDSFAHTCEIVACQCLKEHILKSSSYDLSHMTLSCNATSMISRL